MGWIPYPTAYPMNWPQAGQGQAAAGSLPYTSAQLNNSAIPQSIRDQMSGAQQLQAVATSTAPHTSGLVNGLQVLAGAMGGNMQAQADQAAAPYQSSAQPSTGLLASLLRGGSTSTGQAGTDDSSGQPPATGWGAVGQGAAQAAQSIGRKSDRRLKSDVSRIGTLPNGLAVYRYRLQGGPFEIGCMADEVALVRPDATWFDPDDGFARVDYARIL